MEDIKATLNILMVKTRNVQPQYKYDSTVSSLNELGPQEFYCDCTIFGFDFVSHGIGKSKKAAQTEAARQFAKWLIENGHFVPEEFPQLKNGEQQNGGNEEELAEQPQQQQPPLEDIKCTLHATLGKTKKPLPNYDYIVKNDGRQYFECECTIEGFDFVAHSGRAQTKKLAQTLAAERMAKWLVENNIFNIEQFPWLVVMEKKRQKEAEEEAESETGLHW